MQKKGFEDLNYRFITLNKKIINFEEELKVLVKDVRQIENNQSKVFVYLISLDIPDKYETINDYIEIQ